MTERRWQAYINPLIKKTFVKIEPEEPEQALLKEYARQVGISEHGLEIDILQEEWQDRLIDRLEAPVELNVTEILDAVACALLSKQRADPIIIAFEKQDVAEAVRSYLETKSNTYEYQVWSHHVIREDAVPSPLIEMLQHFSGHQIDVYSFEFAGDFSTVSLEELNVRRDSLIDKQLIWWIPKAKLSKYLGQWTQLRQLFQVYVLEEDLTKSLNIDEIESDLDFMSEFADGEETAAFSYVDNLTVVLNYLKGVIRG